KRAALPIKKESAKKAAEPYAAEAPSSAPAPRPAPVASDEPAPSARPAQSPRAADEEKQRSLDKNALKPKDDAGSEAALARRADQLFAAHRWSEAIAAYRELLRRYPAADAEPRWRTRLKDAQAQAGADPAAPPPTKAAKARPKASAAAPVSE
ncbi:MAG TPA: hypothetical protein VHL80_17330, partial [Polyangia bacterium]|nr:hypothetical protein [Polyangia bacterium]